MCDIATETFLKEKPMMCIQCVKQRGNGVEVSVVLRVRVILLQLRLKLLKPGPKPDHVYPVHDVCYIAKDFKYLSNDR